MTAANTTDLAALRQQQLAPREANLPAVTPGFGSLQSFELAVRQAKLLSSSTLVPAQYRAVIEKKKGRDVVYEENDNAIPNCVIAMNMAQRMGADPLMVMQNLYIVEGRPSWSSQWIIASINGCGRFSPLRFDLKDLGDKEVEYSITEWANGEKQTRKQKVTIRNLECVAWAVEKETGERITSPAVSVEMAVKEGWYQKNGSKWQTMPEVMLRYRTASFFGKLYSPELLMGLQTVEEMQDIVIDAQQDATGSYSVDVGSLRSGNDFQAAARQENEDLRSGASDAPAPTVGDTIDTDTGEIIDASASATAPENRVTVTSEGPGFEDAIAAVKKRNYDEARDIARTLSEGEQKAVETAITNQQNADKGANAGQEQGQQQTQQRHRRDRGQGGLGIE